MLKFILLMSMMFNTMILFSSHPLFFTLMIISQTLILCILLNFFYSSMWFSYILFLTFLGGMLILFIYMTSLTSNEILLQNKFKLFLITMITFMFFMLMIKFMNLNYSMMMNQDSMNLQNFITLYDHPKNLNMMYNKPNYLITIMMISYLLISLIIVINISNPKMGALRHLF
uniref:NADH-ubiquinone oxidoreductase chain 6 n=1 Tax=Homoeoxipha nigripes TaxID=2697520 RepID=A0A6B9VWV4_9ORTH|nr:NADH dehydrogenase subunit 6 [Homoeoxipha nigripes]QHQ73131.1 NADH dehydrogenase subunit 6 [Homoeoxipha nigripes]